MPVFSYDANLEELPSNKGGHFVKRQLQCVNAAGRDMASKFLVIISSLRAREATLLDKGKLFCVTSFLEEKLSYRTASAIH